LPISCVTAVENAAILHLISELLKAPTGRAEVLFEQHHQNNPKSACETPRHSRVTAVIPIFSAFLQGACFFGLPMLSNSNAPLHQNIAIPVIGSSLRNPHPADNEHLSYIAAKGLNLN